MSPRHPPHTRRAHATSATNRTLPDQSRAWHASHVALTNHPFEGSLFPVRSKGLRFLNQPTANKLVQNTNNQCLIWHALFQCPDLNVAQVNG